MAQQANPAASKTLIRSLIGQAFGFAGLVGLILMQQADAVLIAWIHLQMVVGVAAIFKHAAGKVSYNLKK